MAHAVSSDTSSRIDMGEKQEERFGNLLDDGMDGCTGVACTCVLNFSMWTELGRIWTSAVTKPEEIRRMPFLFGGTVETE